MLCFWLVAQKTIALFLNVERRHEDRFLRGLKKIGQGQDIEVSTQGDALRGRWSGLSKQPGRFPWTGNGSTVRRPSPEMECFIGP